MLHFSLVEANNFQCQTQRAHLAALYVARVNTSSCCTAPSSHTIHLFLKLQPLCFSFSGAFGNLQSKSVLLQTGHVCSGNRGEKNKNNCKQNPVKVKEVRRNPFSLLATRDLCLIFNSKSGPMVQIKSLKLIFSLYCLKGETAHYW